MKTKNFKAVITFVLIFTFQQLAFAEAPNSIEKIPLFKGMKLVSEEKAPADQGLHFGIRKTFTAKVPIEEVVAYYEKELGITKRFEEPEDQNYLRVGQTQKPTIQVYFWNDSDFIDGSFGADGDSKRAWIKKALEKRKKDKENAWIESANTEWYYRDSKTTMTTLHLMLQDLSINEEEKKYDILTEMIIEVLNYDYE
ncbi:hypothetical protein MASR2M78_20730 [Treponema sp.]